MQCLSYLFYLKNRMGAFFLFKMNDKLCRLCGCEVKELDLCIKCHLSTTATCNYCKNVIDVNTHFHGGYNGL